MKQKKTLLYRGGILIAVSAACAGILLSCSPVQPADSSSAVSFASPASNSSEFYKSAAVSVLPSSQASSAADEIQYYFPRAGQKAQPVLIGIINSAKQTLDVAIYSFTDKDIASALVKAKKRGVSVKVITDRTQSETRNQQTVLKQLTRAGIPVKVDTHSGIMHLKVTVADGETATTGSFNYTLSAENSNDEVFVVLNSKKIAQDFDREFKQMWNDSGNFKKYA